MRNIKITGAVLILILIAFTSWRIYNGLMDISCSDFSLAAPSSHVNSNSEKPVVYFGVISRFSPHLLYKGYQPVMDYLTETTEFQFKLRLSKTYDETVSQLANGEVDVAFLGSYIYTRDRDKYGLECLVMPLNENGQPFFHSAVVTRDTSRIYSIEDLAGKRLALPSRQSFSGNWLMQFELQQHTLSVADLSAIQHFPHHHMVIHQILKGAFDAGVVKDRVAKEFTEKGIRIFALSEALPGSPVVAGPKSSPAVVTAVKAALLAIDPSNPEFSERLKDWDIEFAYGFTTATYADYTPLARFFKQKGNPR